MQRWKDVQKLYVKKYMVELDEQEQLQCNNINTMLKSAGNPMFLSELRYQTPIILDLGANKSIIPTIQAYQNHTHFPKVFRLGETHKVDIIGIEHVGGVAYRWQSSGLLLAATYCAQLFVEYRALGNVLQFYV
jgi:hypothetical protein